MPRLRVGLIVLLPRADALLQQVCVALHRWPCWPPAPGRDSRLAWAWLSAASNGRGSMVNSRSPVAHFLPFLEMDLHHWPLICDLISPSNKLRRGRSRAAVSRRFSAPPLQPVPAPDCCPYPAACCPRHPAPATLASTAAAHNTDSTRARAPKLSCPPDIHRIRIFRIRIFKSVVPFKTPRPSDRPEKATRAAQPFQL